MSSIGYLSRLVLEEPCYDKQFIRTAIQRFITHLMKIEANMTRKNRNEPSAALNRGRKTIELLRAVDVCIVSVEDFSSPDMQEVLRTGWAHIKARIRTAERRKPITIPQTKNRLACCPHQRPLTGPPAPAMQLVEYTFSSGSSLSPMQPPLNPPPAQAPTIPAYSRPAAHPELIRTAPAWSFGVSFQAETLFSPPANPPPLNPLAPPPPFIRLAPPPPFIRLATPPPMSVDASSSNHNPYPLPVDVPPYPPPPPSDFSDPGWRPNATHPPTGDPRYLIDSSHSASLSYPDGPAHIPHPSSSFVHSRSMAPALLPSSGTQFSSVGCRNADETPLEISERLIDILLIAVKVIIDYGPR